MLQHALTAKARKCRAKLFSSFEAGGYSFDSPTLILTKKHAEADLIQQHQYEDILLSSDDSQDHQPAKDSAAIDNDNDDDD